MNVAGSNKDGNFGGRRDVVLMASNALSLAVIAGSGVIINAVLAGYFGVDRLGQFNKLVALHLVVSQLTAFGIHLSCLHYLGTLAADSKAWAASARAAIVSVIVVGLIVAIMLGFSAGLVANLLGNPNLIEGIRWVAPAVALFGLNKVLLSLYNTSDRLHALAFLQALRPIAWLIGAGVLVHLGNASPVEFGQILFYGELAATLPGMLFLPGLRLHSFADAIHIDWITRHLRFGMQAMPSHLIIVLNTRIDILILAFFANDAIVGIYSFVALLAEGVFQVGVVIRTVINNRLVSMLLSRDYAGLQLLKWQAGRWSLFLTTILAGILLAGFAPVITWLGLNPALLQGELSLWLLMVGVVACAVHSPLWMTLVLSGRPVQHSQLMLALCALNIVLNITLIPLLGMLGAAIGTAIMLAAFPLMLSWTTKRILGVAL